jgi:very-short-patch-repair endonuclease
LTSLRISAARRLGALPKAKPLTPAARALAKASRDRYEDLLWSQLRGYAAQLWIQKDTGPGGSVLEWSTMPVAGVASSAVTSYIARRQYEFLEGRKYRADVAIFANPGVGLLVEVDGGLYVHGGHSRGAGREADLERDALAQLDGWRVLRVSPRHVKDGRALSWISALLERKP